MVTIVVPDLRIFLLMLYDKTLTFVLMLLVGELSILYSFHACNESTVKCQVHTDVFMFS